MAVKGQTNNINDTTINQDTGRDLQWLRLCNGVREGVYSLCFNVVGGRYWLIGDSRVS